MTSPPRHTWNTRATPAGKDSVTDVTPRITQNALLRLHRIRARHDCLRSHSSSTIGRVFIRAVWSIGNRKNSRLKFPSLCRLVVRQTGAALIYESAVILVFHCRVSTHSVCLHYCPVKYLSEKRWKQEAPGWKFQQFDQLVLPVGQSVNVLAAVLS